MRDEAEHKGESEAIGLGATRCRDGEGVTYTVTNFSELESLPVGDHGLHWHPVRSALGIRAFGMNSYTSTEVGGEIVEDHTEETYGHEEVYVVISGRARFTLGDEEIDAPAGTIVHLPDPTVRRRAVALEPETRVLAVGGKPGEAFKPSAWELFFRASRLPPDEALRVIEEGKGYNSDPANFQYNLACFRALAGKREEAIEAFRQAAGLDLERVRRWAPGDSDLDSIRAEVHELLRQ
jgi:mannose-6-phosphate isomerase-like protein (cupin superfamily)